jgi:hypothetical protein
VGLRLHFFFYACSERLINELLVAFLDLRVGLRSWACVQLRLVLFTVKIDFIQLSWLRDDNILNCCLDLRERL